MPTKINRPVAQHKTSPQQEWYDLGYSDALEDADNVTETSSLEERLSKVEACLAALTLGDNRNQQGGGTI